MSTPDLNSMCDEVVAVNAPLPRMENVRRDVAKAPNVRRSVQGPDIVAPFANAPLGQRAQDLLPDLFNYGMMADCDDIPRDLVEECLWVLEITSYFCQARGTSNWLRVQAIVAMRLCKLYSRPDVEQPARVVEHMRNLFSSIRRADSDWDLSMLPLQISLRYAVALSKVAADDDEAEQILVRFLAADDSNAVIMYSRIMAQLYLSRVLRRKGREQDASAMETELVRWFKRNPHILPDAELDCFFPFDPNASQMDPVLTALGGRSWLQNRKRTMTTEARRGKFCIHCDGGDHRVTLKSCGACKQTWYCSVKCQKANWPFHKELCKWIVHCGKQSSLIRQEGDSNMELHRELHEWATGWDAKTNPHLTVHALGIHRDRTRGRTHIFYKQVEHDPSADSIAKTCSTSSCGVFRLEDVLGTLETELGLLKGQGPEHFRKYLLQFEPDNLSHMVPMLQYVRCGQEASFIICKGLSISEINEVAYDPNWIQSVNRRGKQAPQTMLHWHGAKNVEHDF